MNHGSIEGLVVNEVIHLDPWDCHEVGTEDVVDAVVNRFIGD